MLKSCHCMYTQNVKNENKTRYVPFLMLCIHKMHCMHRNLFYAYIAQINTICAFLIIYYTIIIIEIYILHTQNADFFRKNCALPLIVVCCCLTCTSGSTERPVGSCPLNKMQAETSANEPRNAFKPKQFAPESSI